MRTCQNIKETVYTYDANGSQTTKTTDVKTETNTYNAVNQLVGFTDGETTASYTYNADGLRASKTVDGETVKHVWDGAKQVVADVKNGAFYQANCYIRGTGLIAKYSYVNGAKSEYTYYTQNAHGDVVNLTDKDGIVIKTYKYDAFGVEKNIDNADTNAFRYCGEYYDSETGTIYLRARHYSPSNGRFTQRDSFAGKQGDPLSLNLYTYCHNNPIVGIDPSGHTTMPLPWSIPWSIPQIPTMPQIPTIPHIPAMDPDLIQDYTLPQDKTETHTQVDEAEKEVEQKNKPNTLYHYTNKIGMVAILGSQRINPSLSANNPKDARYGDGQYLSDISPWAMTAVQLASKFIRKPNKYKFTNYVEIDVTGLNVVKGRGGVYVIPNEEPLSIAGRVVSFGNVGG